MKITINIYRSFLPLLTLVLLACSGSGNEDELRFAFLTDLHISPMGESSEQLALLVQEVNAGDFDLVVIAGDLSNQGSCDELTNVKTILDELTIPYLVIPGNHETNWSESAGQGFRRLWNDDRFFFQKENFLLAGINTGPFMRMGDGHVKQEDINWLRAQLETSMKHDKQLLFFAHYPLAEGLDQWYEVTDILNTYHTPIAFCGHGHRQQLLNFDGLPGIMGRSLVLRGENIPGYNIIEIRNDSLFAFEKIIGKDLVAPNIALDLSNAGDAIAHLDVSGRPEYSINDIYPHVSRDFYHREEASVFTGPLVLGDTLVVFGNSLGHLKAINTIDDAISWEITMKGPLYATPAYTDGIILMGDLSGSIYGINLISGEISWELKTIGPVVAGGLIEDGYYYGGSGSDGFYKINVSNGEISWVFNDIDGLVQAQPAIHDDYLVFTAWDTHVYCLDKSSGELIWKWNNSRPVDLLSPGNVVPVISNDKVFIVAPDRYMTALDLVTGKEVWRTNKHQVRESLGLSEDRQSIFAKLMNDSIVAVSATGDTVETLWSLDAGFGYDHNPCPIVVKNNLLYAATKNGLVMAIDIHKQDLVWKHKVSNSAINFLHAENNKLWLTSADGKVVSIKH
jgi:outer membrane protein assembly factor BamB/predicted phosphohydrolase